MLSATVSGSFHKHLGHIYMAVAELAEAGVDVLSPADPRVVGELGEFLFVASDLTRSIRLVQDRHLRCIRASSFLLLVAPDGYVGQSAAMEIGVAIAAGTPVFCTHVPSDQTLSMYVTRVPNLSECISSVSQAPSLRGRGDILIDPHAAVESVHETMDDLDHLLTNGVGVPPEDVERTFESARSTVARALGL